jgi:hypothetical protein
MTYHVDLIQTDWAAGTEQLAARLVLNGKGVQVTDSDDPDAWASRVLRPIPDGFGEMVVPDKNPKLFLFALAGRHSAGTYVHAIGPHEQMECPFEDHPGYVMRLTASERPSA